MTEIIISIRAQKGEPPDAREISFRASTRGQAEVYAADALQRLVTFFDLPANLPQGSAPAPAIKVIGND